MSSEHERRDHCSVAGCHAAAVCLALCVGLLATFAGCGGCRKDPQAKKQSDREKKAAELRSRKKKPKENFELGKLLAQPCDRQSSLCWYKPGHWTIATLDAKANNFDFVGELETAVTDSKGRLIPLVGLPFVLDGLRTVALPKGQQKSLQSVLFVPCYSGGTSLSLRLCSRKRGRHLFQRRVPLSPMPSYQYHFPVLARWPERYVYLDDLASVTPPTSQWAQGRQQSYYRVALLSSGGPVRLPSASLFWTSIAYVLWDEVEPNVLNARQQQAMLDWLHWGGQLIISGPDTLEGLRDSFLGPYLPADAAGVKKLQEADFEAINARYCPGTPGGRLVPIQPWTGVELAVRRQARHLPGTGGLLAERRVGRGRVVVSAFRLSGRELTGWPGFDGFFNACLLRRPSREFYEDQDGQVQLTWADHKMHRFDARRICRLRYFTRDTEVRFGAYAPDVVRSTTSELADIELNEDRQAGPGVAAWDGFNPTADEARKALRDAARIEIPDAMFVVWVMAGYLLVLVPVNWAVFKAIGRVEWAWAAAPVIAVACAVTVIRLARLDIGFARSATEIAVIEVQADYSRAHLTRYTALYTSLTTTYDFRSEDPGTILQPLPAHDDAGDFRLAYGQSRTTLYYRHGKDVSLRGYLVKSNTTGMVHSEQMVDLGGSILLQTSAGSQRVANRTGIALRGASVVGKTASGEVQAAWIGTIQPATTAELRFKHLPSGEEFSQWWDEQQNGTTGGTDVQTPSRVNFDRLLNLARDPAGLCPGEFRLVAWTQESVPGLQIKPAAPQSRQVAMVVAHLCYGPGDDPQADANTRAEVDRPASSRKGS